MKNDCGALFSLQLDGKVHAKEISLSDSQQWHAATDLLWCHFDYADPNTESWLIEQSGLASVISEALLVDETRPRTTLINDGLLIALRGINHHSGAEPDDMVSLRMWITKDRIYTTRRRKLVAASTINRLLQQGNGPVNSGDFLVKIIDLIIGGMSDTIVRFEENVADYEDAVLEGKTENLRY